MKKIGYFLLSFILLIGTGICTHASASTNFVEEGSCVVAVRLTCTDNDGQIYWTEESSGILVGNAGEGASYVVAPADKVSVSETEKIEIGSAYALDEEALESINSTIEIVIGYDIKVSASIQTSSQEMNLAILHLNQTIYDRDVAVFNMDEESYYIGQGISVVGENDKIAGVIQGETMLNGMAYIQHDITVSGNSFGAALVNSANEVIAMHQNTMIDGFYCALDIKEIANVLRTLGIPYMTADHTDYSVDKSALITAIQLMQGMDLSGYTEESAMQMKALLGQAEAVSNNEAATREEVDAMCQQLMEMQTLLVEDTSLSGSTIALIIVASVCFLAFAGTLTILTIRKRQKRKKEEEAALLESKRAPVNQGPFIPESVKQETPQIKRNVVSHKQNTYKELSGFAPTSATIRLDADDTTVLTKEDNNELMAGASLIHCNCDKEILIKAPKMVLGKSASQSDYVIDNSAISRVHAQIEKRAGDYFLSDLKSTNGTFINEKRLSAGEECKLVHGSKIKLANEEFVFIKE